MGVSLGQGYLKVETSMVSFNYSIRRLRMSVGETSDGTHHLEMNDTFSRLKLLTFQHERACDWHASQGSVPLGGLLSRSRVSKRYSQPTIVLKPKSVNLPGHTADLSIMYAVRRRILAANPLWSSI